MEQKRRRTRKADVEDLGNGPKIEERIIAMVAQLLGIVTLFVAPLVIFLTYRNRSEFVAFHSLQATLFELAVFLVLAVVCVPLMLLVVGFVLVPLVVLGNWVYLIIVGLLALQGETTGYFLVGGWARKLLGG